MRIMFYNTENTFDYKDNPDKADDDFLPTSPRRWTFFKYRQKLINISKVIVACGDGDIPSIVGLCEIENDSVIIDLMRLTHLHLLNYKYVVTNSPDARGINIALLYKRNVFKLFDTTEYPIILGNKYKPTRNILHVSGILPTNDTLDVFVCHFPSRSGGEIETRNARKFAHMKLIDVINNVNNLRRKPLVIVMGDFNDYPTSSNLSYLKRVPERVNNITNTVKSKKSTIIKSVDNFNNTVDNYNAIVNMEFSGLSKNSSDYALYNLMLSINKWNRGTYKYNGEWGFLDQFFANSILVDTEIYPVVKNAKEARFDFLLTEDTKFMGKRTLRTFYGYKYENGYSDHLPIICDIFLYPDSTLHTTGR